MLVSSLIWTKGCVRYSTLELFVIFSTQSYREISDITQSKNPDLTFEYILQGMYIDSN